MAAFTGSVFEERHRPAKMSPFLRHLRSRSSLANIPGDDKASPHRNSSTTTTTREPKEAPIKVAIEATPTVGAARSTWSSFKGFLRSPKSQAQTPDTSPPTQTPLDSEPCSPKSEPAIDNTPKRKRSKLYRIPAARRLDPMKSSLPRHVAARHMLGELQKMGPPGIRHLTDDQIAMASANLSAPTPEQLRAHALQEVDWSLTPYMRWRRYGDIALHRPQNIDRSGRRRQSPSRNIPSADKQVSGDGLDRSPGLPSPSRSGRHNCISPRVSPGSSAPTSSCQSGSHRTSQDTIRRGGVSAGRDHSASSSQSGSSRSSQETVRSRPLSSDSSYEALPRYQLYDTPMPEQSITSLYSTIDLGPPSPESQTARQTLFSQLHEIDSQNRKLAIRTPLRSLETALSASQLPSRCRLEASQGPVTVDVATDEVANQERRDTAVDLPSTKTTPKTSPDQTKEVPSVLDIVARLRISSLEPSLHIPTAQSAQSSPPPSTLSRTPSLRTNIHDLDSIKETLLLAKEKSTTSPTESTLLSEITWLKADLRHFSHDPDDAGKKVLTEYKLEGKLVEIGFVRAWQAEGVARAGTAADDACAPPKVSGSGRCPHWPPPSSSIYGRRHGLSPRLPRSAPRTMKQERPWRIELYDGLPRWKQIWPRKRMELHWPPSCPSVYGRRYGRDATVPPPLTRDESCDGPASPAENVGGKGGNVESFEYLGHMGVM